MTQSAAATERCSSAGRKVWSWSRVPSCLGVCSSTCSTASASSLSRGSTTRCPEAGPGLNPHGSKGWRISLPDPASEEFWRPGWATQCSVLSRGGRHQTVIGSVKRRPESGSESVRIRCPRPGSRTHLRTRTIQMCPCIPGHRRAITAKWARKSSHRLNGLKYWLIPDYSGKRNAVGNSQKKYFWRTWG